MASLQTHAEELNARQRTEEQARSQPRSIVIAHERSLGTLVIRHDDAKALIRDGLLWECGQHDLHLVEFHEWDLDDVERLLTVIARASKVEPIKWPTSNVVDLKKRVHPVYEPPPVPDSQPKPVQSVWPFVGMILGAWAVVFVAYSLLTWVI